mmetsp:Transcript_19926/g.54958  ORF Transcript_19926/g.54958 Transcript_19926/m.54958 type:complete len:113 (+) Transcript_19926:2188-2526(+)
MRGEVAKFARGEFIGKLHNAGSGSWSKLAELAKGVGGAMLRNCGDENKSAETSRPVGVPARSVAAAERILGVIINGVCLSSKERREGVPMGGSGPGGGGRASLDGGAQMSLG